MDEQVIPVNSFIVALSPLTKIFQARFHDELKRNPQIVFEEKPFQIVVDKPSGAFNLEFKKPKQLQDPALINWLTGGKDGTMCRETDYTGIIYAPVQDDMLEALTTLTSLYTEDPEKAKLAQESITKDIGKKYGNQIKAAKAMSDARVMRQIKTIHTNLQKQFALNKENNLGAYIPSTVEFLCTYVLSAELDKDTAETSKLTKEFARLMEQTRTI